jgi:cytochrome b561
MEISAHAMHWLLYLLMLGMPVLGVLALAWSGKPIAFLGPLGHCR